MPKLYLNNKDHLRMLRTSLEAALSKGFTDTGVTFKIGNITYMPDGSSAKLSIQLLKVGEKGEVVTPEFSDLTRYAPMVGIGEEYLKDKFELGGHEFRLCGYKVRASKKPFLIKRLSDGKVFKTSIESVKRAMGIK